MNGLRRISLQEKRNYINSCINQMSILIIIGFNVFNVTIGNTKNIEMHDFHLHVPEIKYAQDDKNTCFFE